MSPLRLPYLFLFSLCRKGWDTIREFHQPVHYVMCAEYIEMEVKLIEMKICLPRIPCLSCIFWHFVSLISRRIEKPKPEISVVLFRDEEHQLIAQYCQRYEPPC